MKLQRQQQKDKVKSQKASTASPGPLALCAIETPRFSQATHAYYSKELAEPNPSMDYSLFTANFSSEFIIDSGSTRHICNNHNLFATLNRSYSSSIKIKNP